MPDNGFTAEEMKVLLPLFLDTGRQYVAQLREGLLRLRNLPNHEETLSEMHRAVHSLKGAALQLGYDKVGSLANNLEDAIEGIQEAGAITPAGVESIDEGAQLLTEQLAAVESQTAARAPSADLLARLAKIAAPASLSDASPDA